MYSATRILLLALVLASSPTVGRAAQRDTVLTIGGDVEHPYVLSAAEFSKLPHTHVIAEGHDAKESKFEGVLVADLLLRAGVKFGNDMRGPRVAYALVVGAADGYRAVFAVAELDTAFTSGTVLLSDRRDGQPTIPSEGPLRMVSTDDKHFARWVRQVTSLTLHKL